MTTTTTKIDPVATLLSLADKSADDTAVQKYIRAQGRAYMANTDKSETAKGQAAAAAALAAHLATVTGLLLPAGEKESAASGGALGASNYVKLFAGEKGNGDPAVSPSNVPHWRTLGHMIVVVGVPVSFAPRGEDKSTWQLASQTPGTVLTDAVYAEDATEDSIRAALLTVKRPNGDRIATGNGGKGKARQKTGDGSDETADMIKADPVGAALTALSVVAAACKAIPDEDTEGWSRVESAINAILTRENTGRIGRAKKAAAKKAATSKPRAPRKPRANVPESATA